MNLVGHQVIFALEELHFQKPILPCPLAARVRACTLGLAVRCPLQTVILEPGRRGTWYSSQIYRQC